MQAPLTTGKLNIADYLNKYSSKINMEIEEDVDAEIFDTELVLPCLSYK